MKRCIFYFLALMLLACNQRPEEKLHKIENQNSTDTLSSLKFPIQEVIGNSQLRKNSYFLKWNSKPNGHKIDSNFVKRYLCGFPIEKSDGERFQFEKYGSYYFFDYVEFQAFLLFTVIYDDECGFDEYYQFTYSKSADKITSVSLIAFPGADGGQLEEDYLRFSDDQTMLTVTEVSREDVDLFDPQYEDCYATQIDSCVYNYIFSENKTVSKLLFRNSKSDTVCSSR